MPHGIDLPATPKSNYSCYLLYEQPSVARIHSFTHIHFYFCKRLLGRNNTATTSAPHESCQHLFKGALLLSYNATDSRLFLHFFFSPMVVLSWLLWQDNSLGSIHLTCIHLNHRVPAVFTQRVSRLAILCSSSRNFCLFDNPHSWLLSAKMANTLKLRFIL